MSTWVLVFYMSTNSFTSMATGGPVVIDGFSSYANCNAAKSVVAKLPQYDWAVCIEVKK